LSSAKSSEHGWVGAIDLGTTGVRFALFDHGGHCVASAYQPIPIDTPQPGWVEQNPDRMLAATRAVVRQVLSEDTRFSHGLNAVGIANQRETVIAWDRNTGRPLHPAIVWQDRRTAARCDELRNSEDAATLREKTGLSIDPYFSATKMEWLLDHVPGLRDRATDGLALLGTVDAWLLWQLTGVHATDDTNASRTMLYNVDRSGWDDDLLQLFGVPSACLPTIRPSLSTFGAIRPEFTTGTEVPVTAMLGDQQAALLGQGLTAAGEAQVTWGTGAFLLMNTGRKRATSQAGLLTTVARTQADAAACYALEGSVFVAGAAMQWLRDGLGLLGDVSEAEPLAESVDSTDGVVFVPALTGLGAPHWDAGARGLLIGLTRGTRREHLIRAGIESIAYQTHDVVRAMEADAGSGIPALHVGGGAARNDFLCQFQSDLLGVPVVRPADLETTARGAAYAAGVSSGFWENLEAIRHLSTEDRRFEPAMGSATRDRLLHQWHRAIERAKGWEAES